MARARENTCLVLKLDDLRHPCCTIHVDRVLANVYCSEQTEKSQELGYT